MNKEKSLLRRSSGGSGSGKSPVFVRRTRISRDAGDLIILSVVGVLLSCVTVALQTTLLGRVTLPFLSPAAPSLGLLLVLAAGYLLDRESGGICGLVTGFLCDAAGDGGLFILPLIYFLCGYAAGAVGRRILGHNLPSFAVFAAVGAVVDGGIMGARAVLSLRGLPPVGWMLHAILPRMILTVLFSPAVYAAAYLIVRALRVRGEGGRI